MKIKATQLMSIALIPVAFIISYYLLSHYTDGDQAHYHRFYDSLNGAPLSEMMPLALDHVSSAEPLSVFVLWLGSNFNIEKNIYISSLNVILILSIFLLTRRHSVNILITGLLLTNFYLVVLMTGAERLKIAYIFTIIATLYAGKVRLFLLAVSPMAHFQNFVLLSGVVSTYFEPFTKNIIFNLRVSKKTLLSIIIFLLTGAIIGYFFFESAITKVGGGDSIAIRNSASNFLNISILSFIAIFVTYNRFRMCLVLFPMFIAVAFLGGDRTNMIAATLVIYYLMLERRLNHPLMYVLMLYFSIKTIPFVLNIIHYGNGFANL